MAWRDCLRRFRDSPALVRGVPAVQTFFKTRKRLSHLQKQRCKGLLALFSGVLLAFIAAECTEKHLQHHWEKQNRPPLDLIQALFLGLGTQPAPHRLVFLAEKEGAATLTALPETAGGSLPQTLQFLALSERLPCLAYGADEAFFLFCRPLSKELTKAPSFQWKRFSPTWTGLFTLLQEWQERGIPSPGISPRPGTPDWQDPRALVY